MIYSNTAVHAMLVDFKYYDNYVELIRMELNAISSVSWKEPRRKFAILGSGPLPLTSLCILNILNQEHHQAVCIHNVDRDPRAISSSAELCRKLGHTTNTMCFHCVDVKVKVLTFRSSMSCIWLL